MRERRVVIGYYHGTTISALEKQARLPVWAGDTHTHTVTSRIVVRQLVQQLVQQLSQQATGKVPVMLTPNLYHLSTACQLSHAGPSEQLLSSTFSQRSRSSAVTIVMNWSTREQKAVKASVSSFETRGNITYFKEFEWSLN